MSGRSTSIPDIAITFPELSPTSNPSPAEKVIVPPNAVAVDEEPSVTVIDEFANLLLAIEPANSALAIPLSLIVTTPLDTAKLSLENDATPLLDVLASSPAIVMVSSDTVVSTPSPPVKVNVPPVVKVSLLPLSAASVNDVLIDVEPPSETAEPLIVLKNLLVLN